MARKKDEDAARVVTDQKSEKESKTQEKKVSGGGESETKTTPGRAVEIEG